MENVKLLSSEEILQALAKQTKSARSGHTEPYLAYYSSWLGGITTEPVFMQLPIDDHMVHRGDGVFEAFKCIEGKLFLLDAHLDRLEKSAQSIFLDIPFSRSQIVDIIQALQAVAQEPNLLFRLYLSRGPGGFSPSPYESVGSQLYIVATRFKAPSEDKYKSGVKIGISQIPQKEPFYAQIKSCNYLPNVLMKKEALDRDLDFTISIDADGFIAEGATENIAIFSAESDLCFPRLDKTLRGTTLLHVMKKAEEHLAKLAIRSIQSRDISVEDLKSAKEVFMIGTTLDVLPVSQVEDVKIKLGPLARELRKFCPPFI